MNLITENHPSIKAEIITDSINSHGNRLTTYVLEYPRFIHAEVLTHRVFSKNASSSRAIPIEKMIQQVVDNPAVFVWWGKNQSGMQAKEELSSDKPHYESLSPKQMAQNIWLQARDKAVDEARALMNLGCHKQIANRLLEPWQTIRVILSGTEFENFFALRAHADAQPEIQVLAYKMLEEYNKSQPKQLKVGEWHVPFGDRLDSSRVYDLFKKQFPDDAQFDIISSVLHFYEENPRLSEIKRKISVARCARVSYLNHEGNDDYEADMKLCDRLLGSIPRHMSPTEHIAQCQSNSDYIGNFRGFKQYRYFFDDQNLRDSRVINKTA